MILVLGSGNFATSLAQHLAQKSKVVIYSRRQEVVHSINTWNKNPTAFPDFVLHHNISAIGQFSQQLLDSAAYIVYSIPTQAQRSVLLQIAPFLTTQLLIFVNKGIEISTGKLPSEICADILGPLAQTCAYLSGPSFAAEIMLGQPTACSISSPSPESARRCHALFQSENFLIYDSLDVIGVQIAGALKNVIALASGACMGVGFMQNSRAALITRGLAEITRFGIALGADPITFSGLVRIF
jgi:glycerol-3-phosphate dehydrogenase (NAD(P)+)